MCNNVPKRVQLQGSALDAADDAEYQQGGEAPPERIGQI